MKSLEFTQQLPEGFDDRSRVWIYQCSRLLSLSEVLDAESRINEFVQSWSSHGAAVKGFGTVFDKAKESSKADQRDKTLLQKSE